MDKHRPQKPLASILLLDLTQGDQQEIVLRWIRNPATKAVFLAPPCGTASAARNIVLDDEPWLPQPLRSNEDPDGVACLDGNDFLRVEAANVLYQFVCDVFMECQKCNVACAVENPLNSLFWETTPWKDLQAATQIFFQCHQACMYGSRRPKWTMLAANFAQISSINKTCDNSHTHEPWGVRRFGQKRVFATSLEVHYPKGLCEAITNAFMLRFAEWGLQVDESPQLQQTAAATTFKQTAKSLNLVPQYKNKLITLQLHGSTVWPLDFIPPSDGSCKTLHKSDLGVEGVKSFGSGMLDKLQQQLSACGVDSDTVCNIPEKLNFDQLVLLGVQWKPEEFVEQALASRHPLDLELAVPTVLRRALHEASSCTDVEIAKKRLLYLRRWKQRAKALASDEAELKASMDPQFRAAVESKKILLFEEMLREAEYEDLSVVDELRLGAQLIGEVETTGMLPQRFSPAILSEKMLGEQAKLSRPKFAVQGLAAQDKDVDASVWEQTLQEVNEGWLVGPLELKDVPVDSPISRRFGIRQGTKIRCIDDFSASNVNDAVTVSESPVLHTVDVCAALMLQFMKSLVHHGHKSELLSRTFDLTSACRQVPLRLESRKHSYIAVREPASGNWKFFGGRVLPFGAVRSVHSFLRLSRAVWFLGCVGLSIPWTSFYDDFVVFSTPNLSRSTELSVVALFKLLGWAFAESGKKCVPFDSQCSALGVVFDLSESESKVCKVSNTLRRVEELASDILAVISVGHIGRVDAQKLRGRMQFAEGQLFGRIGKRCVRVLSDHACGRSFVLNSKSSTMLKNFVDMLQSGIPRLVCAKDFGTKIVLTDACYERDAREWICGAGGVFFDPDKHVKEFFSIQLSADQRILLGENSKKQLIFEAETISAVIAFVLWMDDILHQFSILFVDNEATKFSLIKGGSDNPVVDALAEIFCNYEKKFQGFNWIARVSSYSNVADSPSRGDTTWLLGEQFVDRSIDAYILLSEICAAVKVKLGEKAAASSQRSKSAVYAERRKNK